MKKKKIDFLEDGPEKEAAIFNFNRADYTLDFDIEAHNELETLKEIENKNRIK